MSITSHVLKGASEKEVLVNGKYREYGSKATSTNGASDITYSNDWDSANLATEGKYTITYTAVDSDNKPDSSVTRVLNVITPKETVESTVVIEKTQTTPEIAGVGKDEEPVKTRDIIPPKDSMSALFDEGNLDPYEVANSRSKV